MLSPTPLPPISETNDSNDYLITAIELTELLGAIVFFLLVAVIFLCFYRRQREKISKPGNPSGNTRDERSDRRA